MPCGSEPSSWPTRSCGRSTNRTRCPLTGIAARHTDDRRDNLDIRFWYRLDRDIPLHLAEVRPYRYAMVDLRCEVTARSGAR